MKVILKDAVLVLIPQTTEERDDLSHWKAAHADHVLVVRTDREPGRRSVELHDLGERPDACREPINVVSTSSDPIARTISNLAETPFVLDDSRYRSVESFWQGLKFPEADRQRIANYDGARALAEGSRVGYAGSVTYRGVEVVVGTWDHWQLMEKACRAKFEQNGEARAALLATKERPLVHIVRRDSRAIPGAIMAQIWMRIRRQIGSA